MYFRKRMLAQVVKRFKDLMAGQTDVPADATDTTRYYAVLKECKLAAQSSHRDPIYDVECGLNLWVHTDGFVYFMPYGEYRYTDVCKIRRGAPKDLVDFAYWNNTDQPKHITNADWEARRDKWKEIEKVMDETSLKYEVVSMDARSDNYPLLKAVIPKS